MEEKVRAGVIGAGWGRYHVESYLQDQDHIAVVAIADLDEARLRTVVNSCTAAGADAPKTYTDHTALLERDDLDVVVVALPNYLHAPMAVDCLEAGTAVLVEKPPSNTVEGAQQIADAVERTGGRCMVGVTSRFRPEIGRLKTMIEGGELGQIYYAKTGWTRRRGIPIGSGDGWFIDHTRAGGGALIDIGVHALDLTWWLMGAPKPATVSGVTYDYFMKELREAKGDVEDFAAGLIRFTNGMAVSVEASWASHIEHGQGYTQILGTKAGLDMDLEARGDRKPICIYTDKGDDWLDISLARCERVDWREAIRGELIYFARCVRHGTANMADAEEGLDLMRMLCGLYESARTGAEVALNT